MFWKMSVLSSLGREHEVAELCDKLVESIDPTTELRLREAGASALLTKASILKAGGDRIGEVASYDTLLSKFGLDSDRELVVLVIVAQERRVEALTSLGRHVEALLACDDIIARCNGKGGPPDSSEHVAWALSAKAFTFAREERSEDAAKVCSEIIGRFGPGSPTPLLERAGRALVERAAHFCDLGRYEEALSDCDTFLVTYQSSAEPWISEAVALVYPDQRLIAARDGANYRSYGCPKQDSHLLWRRNRTTHKRLCCLCARSPSGHGKRMTDEGKR